MSEGGGRSSTREQAFSIRILEQGWLSDPADDPCSHGRLAVTIGGERITDSDGGDYGISESALGLLRTTVSDHTPDNPVTRDVLIPHGCGTIPMGGCGRGPDWSVEHLDSGVRLHSVVRHDDTSDWELHRDVDVVVPNRVYRAVVSAFASEVKAFFEGVEKRFIDDGYRRMYAEFWEEFDSLLSGTNESP